MKLLTSGTATVAIVCVGLQVACSGGCRASPPRSAVEGAVTLDDEPLAEAVVAFVPDDDRGSFAAATTGEDGSYRLVESEGLTPGNYSVRISTGHEGNQDADPILPPVPERVPTKYNLKTLLTIELKPGVNHRDFPLDSRGEISQPGRDD